MTKYTDIADLPPILAPGRWKDQVLEWAKIPPGKVLEIHVAEGEKAGSLQSGIIPHLRKSLPHLRVASRGTRLFIINEAKP